MSEAPSLSVEEGARQLAAALQQLRALVHHHAGRLALEPALDVKALLAAHLHDDALAVTAVRRRLEELGGVPALDGPEPAAPAPPMDVPRAYGVCKPRLAAALRRLLARLDPLADEPGLRLLTELAHRQERHMAELPVPAPPGPAHTGELPRGAATLPPADPLARPSRDPFVTLGAPVAASASLHARMNDAICAAELAARTSHEHPNQPWQLHADLARLAWDGMRHAAVLDRTMAAQGRHWGAEPVDLDPFTAAADLDLAGRLAALAARAEAELTVGPGQDVPPVPAGHLRADAAFHAATCAVWGRHVLGGDAAAWEQRLTVARGARR